jgi:chloramphenicol 3-O-phosphotransferase
MPGEDREGLMTPVEPATARRQLFEKTLRQIGQQDAAGLSGIPNLQERANALRLLAPIAEAPDLVIANVLVNGDRVDLQALSGKDEWSVVLDVDQNAPSEIRSVSVSKRPAAFSGRPGCSGKTSLMAAFCEMADTPWLRFDDHMFGSLPIRFLIWPDTSGALRNGFRSALPAIARAGNQVITVAHGFTQPELESDLQDIPNLFVRLECEMPALISRLQGRSDRWGGLVEEQAATENFDDWRYDLRIDTAANSSSSAASLLLAAIRHRGLS